MIMGTPQDNLMFIELEESVIAMSLAELILLGEVSG